MVTLEVMKMRNDAMDEMKKEGQNYIRAGFTIDKDKMNKVSFKKICKLIAECLSYQAFGLNMDAKEITAITSVMDYGWKISVGGEVVLMSDGKPNNDLKKLLAYLLFMIDCKNARIRSLESERNYFKDVLLKVCSEDEMDDINNI